MTDASALDSVVRAVRPTGTVIETTPLDRGNRKQTTVVRFADADPVVVQRSADRDAIQTEARLLEAIADRTSVPVARPLATGDEAGGWLVTPFVRGDDLHEQFLDRPADDRRALVEQFGRALAQVHDAFEFESYGQVAAQEGGLRTVRGTGRIAGGLELAPNGGEPPAPTADWQQWLGAVGETAITRLPAAFDDLRPTLRETVRHPSVDAVSTPRLFPWDFRPGNALANGAELSAILDWEGPLAADPALSYAKAEYLVADWYVPREQAQRLRSDFRRGYESVRDPPAVDAAHRVTAIASTAVDSRGQVTNPRYPPVDRELAVEFHRESFQQAL